MFLVCFSFKLVLFISNYFDLGTNFVNICPFLFFWERTLCLQGNFLQKLGIVCLVMRRLLISRISTLWIAFLSTVECSSPWLPQSPCQFLHFICIFISPHSFTKGCIDHFDWMGVWVPIGLSILRCLSTQTPVSLHLVRYSLLELLLESYSCFLHFLGLLAFLAFV